MRITFRLGWSLPLLLCACMGEPPPRAVPADAFAFAAPVVVQDWEVPAGSGFAPAPATVSDMPGHYLLTGTPPRLARRADRTQARLNADGTLDWLPESPTPLAARAWAETPDGAFVYLALAADARAPQGRILELVPPVRRGRADSGAARFDAGLFLQAGDPRRKEDHAFLLAPAPNGESEWFRRPHVLAAERDRLWVAAEASDGRDALYAIPLHGPWRGRPWRALRAPVGTAIESIVAQPGGVLTLRSRNAAGKDGYWSFHPLP